MQASLARLTPQDQSRRTRDGDRKGPDATRGALRAGSKKDSGLKREHLPGLDPAVLTSAREAGILEEQLRTLSKLVAKSSTMQDAPSMPRKPALRKNPLSETEEEGPEDVESEEEAASEEEGAAPIEKAVLQLTRIVGDLAKSKDKKGRDVEALLDGVDGDAADPSQSSGGKSKAAVYKKMKSCLRDNPKYLYATVMELMEQDFHVLRTAPGSSSQATSWRAWIEHRSRIGHFPTTIRFCWILGGVLDALQAGAVAEAQARAALGILAADQWILGGVLDALQAGAVAEAQARAALGILAADQAALDNGSWVMAQEALLEEAPPMSSFKGKDRPEQWEQTASKLMDEGWLDVLMWRLKNRDSYLESRKRLGPSGKKEWHAANDKEKEGGTKTKKPGGGKGDRKGSGEKGSHGKGSEASQQQAQNWGAQTAILAEKRQVKALAQCMVVQFGIHFLTLFAHPGLASVRSGFLNELAALWGERPKARCGPCPCLFLSCTFREGTATRRTPTESWV